MNVFHLLYRERKKKLNVKIYLFFRSLLVYYGILLYYTRQFFIVSTIMPRLLILKILRNLSKIEKEEEEEEERVINDKTFLHIT